MNAKSSSYNLIEERWIPVLWGNGKVERVGIRDALTHAHRIRQIAASNPMDNVALLRFLLAVLQWCKPNLSGEERKTLEGAAGIPGDWLEESFGTQGEPNATFDLLRDKGGFYQDESAGGVPVAVTNLLHDLPSGSKIAHFRHTRDDREGMCLACCAMGLARWPGVAGAGTAGAGQSMTASINGTTPTYSIPISTNLLATLLLTWPSSSALEGDAPVWDGASEQSSLGFLKAMTWRSRRVLLAPPDAEGKRDLSPGRCCHCGEQTEGLVRSILFRPGWERPFKGPWPDDPHLLRITRKDTRSVKGKERNIVPLWPSPNDPLEDHVAIWRSVLEGLLQRSQGLQWSATDFLTTLLGNSQALYKHVGTHTVSLPEISPDVAHRLLSEVEWLRQLTWVAAAARAGNRRDPPKGHRVVAALCAPGAKGHAVRSGLCTLSPTAEHELERAFQELVQSLANVDETDSDAVAQVSSSWRNEACEILRRHVGHVVDSTAPGSPLRRSEARQRAIEAVREAVQQIQSPTQKKGVAP